MKGDNQLASPGKGYESVAARLDRIDDELRLCCHAIAEARSEAVSAEEVWLWMATPLILMLASIALACLLS